MEGSGRGSVEEWPLPGASMARLGPGRRYRWADCSEDHTNHEGLAGQTSSSTTAPARKTNRQDISHLTVTAERHHKRRRRDDGV
eukprot:4949695-Prorocentrum_lima.AAC.1